MLKSKQKHCLINKILIVFTLVNQACFKFILKFDNYNRCMRVGFWASLLNQRFDGFRSMTLLKLESVIQIIIRQ